MNRTRLWAVVAVLVLGGSTVIGRSVQVMVVDHARWQERARRQQQRSITVPGPRGDITSGDGYLLATSLDRVAVQVDTHLLPYPELFAQAAAPLLQGAEDELVERLRSGPRAMWLAQRVDRDRAERIRLLAPTALVLVPDSERVYPLGRVAAAVVGFVGREELRTVGRAGFEHHYDTLLAGEPARYLAVRDAVQREIRLHQTDGGRAGLDLELSLWARLQAVCEAELERTIAEVDAASASAVVVDVRDGAVLALAAIPSFDPADPGAVPPERWRLTPVQDAFEPGSTVKPLVAAMALAHGVVRPHERFDCTRRGTEVAGRWVRDHAEPGMYSLDEVILHSANVGVIRIAERLPPDFIWQSFDALGFGRRTGVGFPAEARGMLPAVAGWSQMSRAGFALGQELTTTPLQVAMAYAAVANGGELLRPSLLKRASHDGEAVVEHRDGRVRVMDPPLCERLTHMLELVVSEGTGTEAQVPGYRVAGKTGTAQSAVPGGFDDEHHVAWFAGYLPLPAPHFVVVVAVNQPREDFWASSVAAPAFARIAGELVRMANLPATEQVPESPVAGDEL